MGQIEEEHVDEVVRQVVLAANPVRDLPVPPPRATSAELRARADARHAGRRWALPTAVGTTVAAVVVLGALAGGLMTPGESVEESAPMVPASAPAVNPGTPSPLALSPAGRPSTARSHLAALAKVAGRAPDEPSTGAYTFVHVQTWTAGRSRGARPISRDERLWWAADRSGRAETTVLSQPPPVRLPATSTSDTSITTYEPGKVSVVVDAPSAQAPLLAFQLADRHPLKEGPRGVLRAVADLYRSHHLDPAQRAAALQVLADTDGVDYRGTVVDRSGRSGVAVSVDSDGGATRDVAVFDPGAGRLLSYERVALVGAATSPSRAPALVAYVLYLNSGRTETAGATP